MIEAGHSHSRPTMPVRGGVIVVDHPVASVMGRSWDERWQVRQGSASPLTDMDATAESRPFAG